MRPQHVMFLAFIFAAGILISLIIGKGWYGSTDLATLNSMAAFRQASVLGVWSIMVPNLDYVLSGLGALMSFNFAFFRGEMQIFRWIFLTVITTGALWGIFVVAIGTATTLWRR